MSNHSPITDPEMIKMFEEICRKYVEHAKGGTDDIGEDKLTAADQGELKLEIATIGHKVIINFGQPVAWFGMKPDQAREVAQALLLMADEAEREAFKEVMGDG